MENLEIAKVLSQMADLLEIQEANPFRVRAYRNAARLVDGHAKPMRKLVEEESDLTELPGIGKEMARHIHELIETGGLSALDELAEKIPRSLIDVIELPGVGPKKAKKLWKELGIETVDELEQRAEAGEVAALDGFGAKSQQKILTGIEQFRQHRSRFKLVEADLLVSPLLEYLQESPGVERLEVAGSYRRRVETVGDIDLLAIANDAEAVMERFTSYPKVTQVQMSGSTRGRVSLQSGLEVDLRILTEPSYGAALVYFTGSKEHNIKLRKRAIERGLRLSEYGVFEEEGDEEEVSGERDPWAGEQVAGRTEEDVYATVELPWIAPELREDRGEVEAAAKGDLPVLVELADMKGDLQMHSTWSDGKDSIEEMVAACAARGYEYMALTDHSKALAMTGGLDAKRIREQWEEIEEVQARHPEIRILRSQEVDILADGTLDQDDDVLEELDLVVISVHSRFDLPVAEQTARVLAALQHPQVDILAHPTGRLINRRPPFELQLDEVLQCAKDNGVVVELNAHPERLDLKDTHLMLAREMGLKVAISTDAHRVRDLDLMHYGVEQARRAWLSKSDVVNTLPLDEFLRFLTA
ncbi:MAG: DNA polymerase/3'-5' exonuclease PolX [Thermoanaerobaculia bacterium]